MSANALALLFFPSFYVLCNFYSNVSRIELFFLHLLLLLFILSPFSRSDAIYWTICAFKYISCIIARCSLRLLLYHTFIRKLSPRILSSAIDSFDNINSIEMKKKNTDLAMNGKRNKACRTHSRQKERARLQNKTQKAINFWIRRRFHSKRFFSDFG